MALHLKFGTSSMEDVCRRLDEMRSLVREAAAVIGERDQQRIGQIEAMIDGYCPTVSVVGQVKAGKTALMNAMLGMPDLLPSDVNPWTSVVTSAHINVPQRDSLKAEFTFYDQAAWDGLVKGGGRLGQIAGRFGAESELAEIQRQIDEVREKSKARLGKNYEMLLGKHHKFNTLDRALIERYVCLGGEGADNEKQGRFADITRSADLYFDEPRYPMALTLRDTPGVNDPFLMREQVTLRSLEDVQISVVVLSATQALNTVDLGLMKMLSAARDRNILIFVNRIDELEDPRQQVAEIRFEMEQTLDRHKIKGSNRIWFGSALWANAAIDGTYDRLPDASREALKMWASLRKIPLGDNPGEAVWQLSGVPAFQDGLGMALLEDAKASIVDVSTRMLQNVVSSALVDTRSTMRVASESASSEADRRAVPDMVDQLRKTIRTKLVSETQTIARKALYDIQMEAESFVADLTDRMADQIATSRDAPELDSSEFRSRLADIFSHYSTEMAELQGNASRYAIGALKRLLAQCLGSLASDIRNVPLAPIHASLPTSLGRTIAVDLKAPWMSRWFKRRFGCDDKTKEAIRAILKEEVAVIVGGLTDSIASHAVAVDEAICRFFDTQAEVVRVCASVDAEELLERLSVLGLSDKLQIQRAAALKSKQLVALLDAIQSGEVKAANERSELVHA